MNKKNRIEFKQQPRLIYDVIREMMSNGTFLGGVNKERNF